MIETAIATVDERHDCRDIGPACVPSTVWGTASSRTAKFRSGAVLASRYQQTTTRHPARQSARGRSAGQQHRQRKGELQLSIASPIETPLPRQGQRWQNRPGRHPAPDRRGFRQPSTIVDRRIGRNELSAIRTLLACVDAQHDYFDRAKQATGSGVYATRLVGTPGATTGFTGRWPRARPKARWGR